MKSMKLIASAVVAIPLLCASLAWSQSGNPRASTKESGATSGKSTTAVEETGKGGGNAEEVAQDDDCSLAPPKQKKCMYSRQVAIGPMPSFLISFNSNFFDGLERITTANGFEFRKAGQPVTEYPDTLTVVINPAASFPVAPVSPPHTFQLPRRSDSAGSKTTYGDGEMAGWLPASHGSKSGELREVVEPWPELRPPRIWYVAKITGIKQPLAAEVEVVVTGKGNTALGNVRGGFAYFLPRGSETE